MMLAHEIFDPETNRRVLVDHAFIVAGGEITKAARNWLGNALDANKRSQIMFMDRDDILNLYVVANLPLPEGALPPTPPSPWLTRDEDRKSTRLNSSHVAISYAVFCLKKKNKGRQATS